MSGEMFALPEMEAFWISKQSTGCFLLVLDVSSSKPCQSHMTWWGSHNCRKRNITLATPPSKETRVNIHHAMLLAIGCCFRCACFHTPVYDIGAGSGVM